MFVTDLEAYLQRLEKMLTVVDVADPQVEIEARIVEMTTGFAREIGTEFGFQIGSPGARNQMAGRFQNPSSVSNGVLSFVSGRIIDTLRLDALLSAGEVQGRARMLSKPRVSVQNNTEAIITQGSKIPIPVSSNFSTRVRFETAALRPDCQAPDQQSENNSPQAQTGEQCSRFHTDRVRYSYHPDERGRPH